jgi:quinol monooxygenase YgiN
MPDQIVVFARFLAKAGKEEALKTELLKAIEPTRAESDNITYDLHQAVEQPAVFFFHEQWKDQAALQKHLETPHFKALAQAAEDLQAEPFSVVVTRMVSPPA